MPQPADGQDLPDLPDLPETTMETLEVPPLDNTAIEALHQDVIACRDLLTILLCVAIAYTVSKIVLGWFTNV